MIPRRAMRNSWKASPADIADYYVVYDDLLDLAANERIDPAHVTVTVDADSALLGFKIDESAGRGVTIEGDGRCIKMWLTVDPLQRGNDEFVVGVYCGVTILLRTTADPYRQWERTFVVWVERR